MRSVVGLRDGQDGIMLGVTLGLEVMLGKMLMLGNTLGMEVMLGDMLGNTLGAAEKSPHQSGLWADFRHTSFPIQLYASETLAYTPGKGASAHPYPQLTTPIKVKVPSRLPSAFWISGPPDCRVQQGRTIHMREGDQREDLPKMLGHVVSELTSPWHAS